MTALPIPSHSPTSSSAPSSATPSSSLPHARAPPPYPHTLYMSPVSEPDLSHPHPNYNPNIHHQHQHQHQHQHHQHQLQHKHRTIRKTPSSARARVHKTTPKPKDYVCSSPLCGKRFSKKWNMQAHERLHTGSRPFPCRLGCGASYMWMSSRKGHELNRCRFSRVLPASSPPSTLQQRRQQQQHTPHPMPPPPPPPPPPPLALAHRHLHVQPHPHPHPLVPRSDVLLCSPATSSTTSSSTSPLFLPSAAMPAPTSAPVSASTPAAPRHPSHVRWQHDCARVLRRHAVNAQVGRPVATPVVTIIPADAVPAVCASARTLHVLGSLPHLPSPPHLPIDFLQPRCEAAIMHAVSPCSSSATLPMPPSPLSNLELDDDMADDDMANGDMADDDMADQMEGDRDILADVAFPDRTNFSELFIRRLLIPLS